MPSLPGRPSTAEHQAAVSRRLELLRAELSGSRGPSAYDAAQDPVPGHPAPSEDDPWWSSATRVPGARPRVVAAPASTGGGVAEPSTAPPRQRVLDPEPWVPVPGRHASRRDQPAPGWLPETLRGRVGLGPTQLSVVAVLVAVGLAITAWSVVRASPEPVAASSAAEETVEVSGAAPAPGSREDQGQLVELPDDGARGEVVTPVVAGAAGAVPATGAGESVTVDVAGKVRRPGIAVLPPGSRVVDALEAGGGARAGVDLASLNLARLLVDGEQILVGVPLPPGLAAASLAPGGASAPAGATSPPGALVNLNTATEADLDTLPDVGPVTAQSIISWRAEHGGFSGVDELLEVDGIGEATLGRLAPLVTV